MSASRFTKDPYVSGLSSRCVNIAEKPKLVQLLRYASFGTAFGIIWLLAGPVFYTADAAATEISTGAYTPAYPVKASANNRYLVDQRSVPFMIVGDSPQHLIGKMSKSDAAFYMANRQRYGINSLWVHLLCCNPDGTTFDGISAFTTLGDISTPNPVYFRRVDDMLTIAAMYGITILLNAV